MSAEARLIIEMDIQGANWDALADAFEEQVEAGMKTLASEIDSAWRAKANEQLHTSLKQYLDGLKIEANGLEITAELTGFLAVAIETGQDAYDMKPGLLGGAIARVVPIGKRGGKPINYVTLRPDSKGWKHPGFVAKNIADQVQTVVSEDLTQKVFGGLLSRVKV